jgi:hypothetical protein
MDAPVTQTQITDLYKTILEQENAHNTLFITVLLGIVVILFGVTWWWNKEGANKYIKENVAKEIENQRNVIQELIDKTVNEKYSKLEFEKEILEFIVNQRGLMLYNTGVLNFEDGRARPNIRECYAEEQQLLQKKFGEDKMPEINLILKNFRLHLRGIK